MLENIIEKIKKLFYLATGNGPKIQKMYNDYFIKNGGEFGENFKCYSKFNTSEPYLIKIGDDVTISTGVRFITHDNSVIKLGIDSTDTFGKINIGNNCFIGLGTIIMPGVTLANDIIVGAGSVVTKSFKKEGIVIAGNPAKKICTIEEYKDKVLPFCHNIDEVGRVNKKEYLLSLEDKYFIVK